MLLKQNIPALQKLACFGQRHRLILQIRTKFPKTFFVAFFFLLVPASSRMLLAPAPAVSCSGFAPILHRSFFFSSSHQPLNLLERALGHCNSLDYCLHPAVKVCKGSGTKTKILVLGKKLATITGNTCNFGKVFQLRLNGLRSVIPHSQYCLDQLKA